MSKRRTQLHSIAHKQGHLKSQATLFKMKAGKVNSKKKAYVQTAPKITTQCLTHACVEEQDSGECFLKEDETPLLQLPRDPHCDGLAFLALQKLRHVHL